MARRLTHITEDRSIATVSLSKRPVLYPERMQLLLPDQDVRARILIDSRRPMNDDEYFDFCMQNRKVRIERSGPRGDKDHASCRRRDWLPKQRPQCPACSLGETRSAREAFDSNTEFILPNGAALSPDGSWILNQRLDALTKEQKRRFPPLCPDFVIELQK
jgi:hypothetical protein